MAKYIDAEKLKDILEAKGDMATGTPKTVFYAAAKIVDTLPAADVAEIKRGEWKNNKNDYPECTKCGYMPMYDHAIDDIYYSPYCPNCGAKLEV